MPWDTAIAAFAITAAILLVGGAILLRYQRDRYHFLLMQAALAHGITAFPGTPPGWLVSLRVGSLALVLGLGLVATGTVLFLSADDVDELPGQMRPRIESAPPREGPGSGPAGRGPEGARAPAGMMNPNMQPGVPAGGPGNMGGNPAPFRGPAGPGGGPGMGMGPVPGGGPGPNAGGGNPPARPIPPNPAMERWHRMQNYRLTGMVTGCAGIILAALGIVRMIFSRLERRYAGESMVGNAAAPAA